MRNITIQELRKLVNEENGFSVVDKSTNCVVGTEYYTLLNNSEVIEIESDNNDIIAYIDIDNKFVLFNISELLTLELWEKIFGYENEWYFDNDSYLWVVNGHDTPYGGYHFSVKEEMINTMESDIKEVLYCELRNNTLTDFVKDYEL